VNKIFTCIECPIGCSLSVDIEDCKVVKVSGHKCPKGEEYARSEAENPLRILTSTVLAEGLPVKMVAVRTDAAIPKAKLMEAMAQVKQVRLRKPMAAGEVIIKDLLGLGANLIVTTGTLQKGTG
jgi:CxxC motif-containing protein